MLIGIEASRANRVHKTGVEWYAWQLIQALKHLPEAQEHAWLLYTNTSLAEPLRTGPANWHEAQLSWPVPYLWTQARLSYEMRVRPPTRLFVPAHVLPLVTPKKSFVTIHDVGFHRFPKLYKPVQRAYHEWSTRDIIRRAARIITVSEFSKQELIELYRASPDQVVVIPLGIDQTSKPPIPSERQQAILKTHHLTHPFFLFIGRLERKKNVTLLVEAFTRFTQTRDKNDLTELVFVGPPGEGYTEFQRLRNASPARDAIRVLGYLNEEEKTVLLQSATALVHATWYEGFGLTPLEAMAQGTPAICSRVASLPEVVGEKNALWFDPSNINSLVNALHAISDDKQLRAHLSELGQQWVKKYTWQETAHQTLRVLTD